MLASSNTTTNESRRADADTWIPAFVGMTGGAWGGIAVLSPRYEVPACAGMTEGMGVQGGSLRAAASPPPRYARPLPQTGGVFSRQ